MAGCTRLAARLRRLRDRFIFWKNRSVPFSPRVVVPGTAALSGSDYSSSPIGALPDGSGFLVSRLNSEGTDVPLVLVQGVFK